MVTTPGTFLMKWLPSCLLHRQGETKCGQKGPGVGWDSLKISFNTLITLQRTYRSFARQPCCMGGTTDFFPMGKTVLSYAKCFHCSCHATWLRCKTSIVANHVVQLGICPQCPYPESPSFSIVSSLSPIKKVRKSTLFVTRNLVPYLKLFVTSILAIWQNFMLLSKKE